MSEDTYENSRHRASRFEVPGGWIYYGGPLASPVLVSDPAQWARSADNRAVLEAIANVSQEIRTMSQTLQQSIQADSAAIAADLQGVAGALTTLATNIAALQAQLQPGATVTAADVAALDTVKTNADALAATAASMVAPPPPAAV